MILKRLFMLLRGFYYRGYEAKFAKVGSLASTSDPYHADEQAARAEFSAKDLG